jgi:hypothetical protein
MGSSSVIFVFVVVFSCGRSGLWIYRPGLTTRTGGPAKGEAGGGPETTAGLSVVRSR